VGDPTTKDTADGGNEQQDHSQQRATGGEADELCHGWPSSWIMQVHGFTVLRFFHFPLQWGNSGKVDRGKEIDGRWTALQG